MSRIFSMLFQDNKQKEKQVHNKYIESVSKKTGWSYQKSEKEMNSKKAKYGISLAFYDKYDIYRYDEKILPFIYKDLKWREDRFDDICVEKIIEKQKCTEAEARKELSQTKRKYGIRSWQFDVYNYYDLNEEERLERKKYIEKQKETRKNIRKADNSHKDNYINEKIVGFSNKTGLSEEKIREDIKQANKKYGESSKGYFLDSFWELDDKQKEEYFTRGHSLALSKKYNVDKNFSFITFRKDLTDRFFEDFLGRPWTSNAFLKYNDFEKNFKNEEKVIYKPVTGYGGNGIRIFNIKEIGLKETYNQLINLPEGVVEGFIKEHHEMRRLSNGAVSTIRFVVIRTNNPIDGIETGKVHFLYAALRVSCSSFIGDDEIQICVNLENGRTETNGADKHGNIYKKHPETDVEIKGFEIPYFKEAKEAIEKEIIKNDIVGHYGWDIAISETGPVLIEINSGPGRNLLQLPHNEERKGMKYVIEAYL